MSYLPFVLRIKDYLATSYSSDLTSVDVSLGELDFDAGKQVELSLYILYEGSQFDDTQVGTLQVQFTIEGRTETRRTGLRVAGLTKPHVSLKLNCVTPNLST